MGGTGIDKGGSIKSKLNNLEVTSSYIKSFIKDMLRGISEDVNYQKKES
jgi:hypothetical protein